MEENKLKWVGCLFKIENYRQEKIVRILNQMERGVIWKPDILAEDENMAGSE